MQRIARLTPLHDVLVMIDERVRAVAPRRIPLAQALGRVLAADVAAAKVPPHAIALRDGFAVDAATIADAGAYSPVPLAPPPPRIAAGDRLPDGSDAVLPSEAVQQRDGGIEIIAAVPPGDGVLPASGDATGEVPLRRDGDRLRSLDLAALGAVGIDQVPVREPRIRIVCGSAARTPMIDSALTMLARAVAASGAVAIESDGVSLETALNQDEVDAVFVVGGTGSGDRDRSVRTLSRFGTVAVHGMALSPGQTAGVGFAGRTPVLLFPGRLDATLALWLLIGRQLVARLERGTVSETTELKALKRKVISTIGLTELIPVNCAEGMAQPLAAGYLSLTSLARSDGWIVIPADSEGFAAATPVAVRPWP